MANTGLLLFSQCEMVYLCAYTQSRATEKRHYRYWHTRGIQILNAIKRNNVQTAITSHLSEQWTLSLVPSLGKHQSSRQKNFAD